MAKKIIDIKTISRREEVEFNELSFNLIKEGYEPYGELQITYSPYVHAPGATPGFGHMMGGHKSLTQQFVKYEQD